MNRVHGWVRLVCVLAGLLGGTALGGSLEVLSVTAQCSNGKGETVSCVKLGQAYEVGDGVDKNSRHAASLYDKACAEGDVQGCMALGRLYVLGEGVDKDARRAAPLFEKACSGGSPRGCLFLAMLYEEGRGVDKDERRATVLFEKACSGGDSDGCALKECVGIPGWCVNVGKR